MVKLLVLLLLAATFGAASGTKPQCHELEGTVVLKDDPDICDLKPSIFAVGNLDFPVTLDFSQTDETTLNTFLAKFNEVRGAIVMDGNDKVATLNFGTIKEVNVFYSASPGSNYIVIRNNAKLKAIDWHPSLKALDRDAVMLIYNNPLLASPLDTLRTAIDGKQEIKPYFQSTALGECQFQHPLYPDISNYTTPTLEFLKACKKIKGDFILENADLTALVDPIELDRACLRLVNVNMKGVKLLAPAVSGNEICKDGRKSEIKDNPNLCGNELEILHNYYKNNQAVVIQADRATCTMPCSSSQESQSGVYLYCVSTTVPPPTAKITPSRNAPAGGLASPTQASSNKSSDSSNSGLSGWIIGVVVALIVLLIALFLFMWWMNWLPCCRRHDDKKKKGKGKKKKRPDSSKSTSKEKTTSKPSASSSANTVSNEDVEAKPRKKKPQKKKVDAKKPKKKPGHHRK